MRNKQPEKNISHSGNFKEIEFYPIFVISVVFLIGLAVRLYYLPFDVPIILDGQHYFWYAIDTSILGHFPSGYDFPNNGWPALLSVFFSIFESNNFLDYMNLQRILSVVVSSLTVIPIYLLCRRFVDAKYAVIGAGIFALDPRMIQNSLLGITDSFFILLVSCSLAFSFSNNRFGAYIGMGTAALAALIRYEGLLLIIPLLIIYYIKYGKTKNFRKYFALFAIFCLILLPMAYIRIATDGYDGLTSHVIAGPEYIIKTQITDNRSESGFFGFIANGLVNFGKYLGWIIIPIYIFFIPIGITRLITEKSNDTKALIIFSLVMALPALYAYARDIADPRYLFFLTPILCLISAYSFKVIYSKFKMKKLVIIIIIGIIIGSITFLELTKTDYDYEKDVYTVLDKITNSEIIINNFEPERHYLKIINIPETNFPVLKESYTTPKIIKNKGFSNIEEFIQYGREQGLTHIATDGLFVKNKQRDEVFLNDVFFNEQNYLYLEKEFESIENEYRYQLKIFKINYDYFDLIQAP